MSRFKDEKKDEDEKKCFVLVLIIVSLAAFSRAGPITQAVFHKPRCQFLACVFVCIGSAEPWDKPSAFSRSFTHC